MAYSLINKPSTIPPPPIVDFGWYYGLTPERLGEEVYTVGTNLYPPANTVIAGASVTMSATTPFSIAVGSTSSFENPPGQIKLDNGTHHSLCSYSGMTSTTFTGCLTISGSTTTTYLAKVPVYDPRFYVDEMPLHQPITFDAIDSQGLGLPVTTTASGAPIVSYLWNFGNGATGRGTNASTEYTYSAVPPSIQCTLTVTDTLNRQFSVAHQLNLQNLSSIYGRSIHVGPGTGRPG
jgi:hypothetical protein